MGHLRMGRLRMGRLRMGFLRTDICGQNVWDHGARKFAKSFDAIMSKWRNWESCESYGLMVEGSNPTLVQIFLHFSWNQIILGIKLYKNIYKGEYAERQ